MAEKYIAKITAGSKNIELNPFVELYVASITVGIVKSLKGVDYIKKVDVTVNRGEVTVEVNSSTVPLTPFPNDIIAATLNGMVTTLKGGDEAKVYKIHVELQ